MKEIILITGSTSEIGLLVATTLHKNGYKVFGTSRTPNKYKDKVPFELLPLDLNSQESINICIQLLQSRTPKIDVLINNAGVFLGGSVEETTIEQAQKHFETNFWGAVKMSKAILPIMRDQRYGKIITTGSIVGLIGMPFSSYYSASKHALEGFFKSVRLEVKKFNIHVSILEPSFYKTGIDAASEFASETIGDYNETRRKALDFNEKSFENAPTPEPVADAVLKIIKSSAPDFSYPIGKNTSFLPVLQFLSPTLFEKGFLQELNF